jgi:hypothetical protein
MINQGTIMLLIQQGKKFLSDWLKWSITNPLHKKDNMLSI